MQKRAARIILDAERTTRTLTMHMFNALNWIPFFIEAYIRCSMAFKRIEGTTLY